jgi:hypothetical protein
MGKLVRKLGSSIKWKMRRPGGDSKMVARGRKEKASLIVKSWRDARDIFCRHNHWKRHNFDPSTPPAGTENLHFTLNGETWRAPGPPVTGAQTTWEDMDQVSFAVYGTPTHKPRPEQHSPLDRLTSTQGKKRN